VSKRVAISRRQRNLPYEPTLDSHVCAGDTGRRCRLALQIRDELLFVLGDLGWRATSGGDSGGHPPSIVRLSSVGSCMRPHMTYLRAPKQKSASSKRGNANCCVYEAVLGALPSEGMPR
jgi:hypothetical protein